MNTVMQKLKDHYEHQNTEILLDVAGKELTDEARAILQEVLASRGVSASVVEATREAAAQNKDRQAHLEARLASRWIRLLAFTIDLWGVLIPLYIALLPVRSTSVELHGNTVFVLWLGYFLLRDSIPGQSVGKRILGIRAVRTDSGMSCTWSKSFVRNMTHFFFVLDAIFVFGRRRMRLGDMLADTVVVKANAQG